MTLLPIYYINLAARTDRRDFMEGQFARLALSGTRIEAVTPGEISAADRAAYCNRGNRRFLRENELACTLSHERAWRRMRDDGHERGLFVEDDALFSSLLPPVIAELKRQPFDLIRIEAVGKKARVLPPVAHIGEIALRPFRTTTFGSAAYVLTAKAIDRIVGNEGLRRSPIDVALFSPFVEPGRSLSRVLTDPAMAVQLVKPGGEGRTSGVGRSDVQAGGEPHHYAMEQPIRFRLESAFDGALASARNTMDHLRHLPRGLAYRPIVFRRGADQQAGLADDGSPS